MPIETGMPKKNNEPDIHLLAGQRLMAGFDGTDLNEEIKYLIHDLRVGGLILFAPNVETPRQVKSLCASARSFASQCGLPPLFMAIDQEGGPVARLKKPFFQELDGMPALTDEAAAARFGKAMASLLKPLHINMNFAPVMDCEPHGFEGIMHSRVLRGTPDTVALLGGKIIQALQENGIMAVAKHFPGIGRTTLDSHLHLPVLDTPADTLMQTDLVPFNTAISQQVSGIMLSHILYPRLDDKWPASLSKKIAATLMRKHMGYEGLVMTDDLDMKAVKEDIKVVVQRILTAGIDLFLICHKGPNIATAIQETRDGLARDQQLLDLGLAAFNRIMHAKKVYLA